MLDKISHVPAIQNLGTTYWLQPVTPERLIFGASDQCARPEASDVSTYHEEAHVGNRIPRKFAVPPTSRRYEGVWSAIPTELPSL